MNSFFLSDSFFRAISPKIFICCFSKKSKMADSESRHFDNRLSDHSSHNEDLVLRNGSLAPDFKQELQHLADQFYKEWASSDDPEGFDGLDVYTGYGGAALLHHFLYTRNKDQKHLEECIKIVEKSVPHLRCKYPSFLAGDAGILAIGCSAYVKANEIEKARALYKQLVDKCSPQVLDISSGIPDEVLYGRSGYLYSLMFVKRECSPHVEVEDELLKAVCKAIVKSGVKNRAELQGDFPAPLYYEWHGKAYMGGAHGFSGILFTLLSAIDYVRPKDVETRIRPTIDYLTKLRFPSGNFPSSLGNRSDRLVHWCHGAPGFIFLFGKAFEIFQDYKYRAAAYEAGATVWERGLLKKGFGICHGIAGNGYSLLYIHQSMNDRAFLYRAAQYAKFCAQRGKVPTEQPDRPLSMFEGLAGTIYFLYDLLEPKEAKFPGFVV